MSKPVYTSSIFNVSVLANAVPGFAVSGASIPGMPPAPPVPLSPDTAFPGPAWQARFRHKAKPAVLFDYLLANAGSSSASIAFGAISQATVVAPTTDPAQAFPAPAWKNQFLFGRLTKSAVLFDQQFTVAGSSSAAIAFGATSQAIVVTPGNDPSRVFPSPAWQNQFQLNRRIKAAILFDYQLVNAGNSSASIAFGATAQASVFIFSDDPTQILPAPAWQNRFQFGKLSKNAVLFDTPFALSGSYLNLSGDFSFGALSVGVQGFLADPQASLPGPAWQNRFLPRLKRKNSVLFDSQPGIFGPYCFIGTSEALHMTGLGGTATLVSLDATDGGTVVDENQLGGTSVDANVTLGGTATYADEILDESGADIDDESGKPIEDQSLSQETLGATATKSNIYGGFLYGGCYD